MVVVGGVAVMEEDGCLVGAAPLRPGHPPLTALRWLAPPYAARRGRLLLLVGVVRWGCWLFVWSAPLRPGHPPLAALRWLAPPYAARRGRLLFVVFLVVFQLILGSRVRGNDGGCRGMMGVEGNVGGGLCVGQGAFWLLSGSTMRVTPSISTTFTVVPASTLVLLGVRAVHISPAA